MNCISEELATAYHEAGHAVVSCYYNRVPATVSIVPDGTGTLGMIDFDDFVPAQFSNYLSQEDDKKCYVEMRIVIKLAGSLAHDIIDPSRIRDEGDEYDEKWAMAIIHERASWAENERANYLEACRIIAVAIVESNWSWIANVAHELISKKTLKGEEILRLRS